MAYGGSGWRRQGSPSPGWTPSSGGGAAVWATGPASSTPCSPARILSWLPVTGIGGKIFICNN